LTETGERAEEKRIEEGIAIHVKGLGT